LAREERRQQQNSKYGYLNSKKIKYLNFNVPNAFCFRILDLEIVSDLDISA
jgi:hypothetical protein